MTQAVVVLLDQYENRKFYVQRGLLIKEYFCGTFSLDGIESENNQYIYEYEDSWCGDAFTVLTFGQACAVIKSNPFYRCIEL